MIVTDENGGVGGRWSRGFGSLIRRKQVDSVHVRGHGHHQLARKLSVVDLVAIGKLFKTTALNPFFFFAPSLSFKNGRNRIELVIMIE